MNKKITVKIGTMLSWIKQKMLTMIRIRINQMETCDQEKKTSTEVLQKNYCNFIEKNSISSAFLSLFTQDMYF